MNSRNRVNAVLVHIGQLDWQQCTDVPVGAGESCGKIPAVLAVDALVWFPSLDLSRVWYRLIQAVKIWTMRFGENLRIGEGTLNCEILTRIMINFGIAPITLVINVHNKNSNIQGRSLNVIKMIFYTIRNCS